MAAKGEGEFAVGDWCRFCKAKNTCRARAEEYLRLAQMEFKPPELLSEEEIAEVLKVADELAKWSAPNSTQAVISKIFCIFFGILSQKRNSIIPIGNIQKSGWYRKAPVKSIRSTQNHALDIPQPAQEIPVRKRIGQVIPNTDSKIR